ncbi:phage tail protein [Sporosarcina sp. P33]|uniref:phage tail protein n=1 Tax=Sporosarcina sp. P33 TaxID=1930764 RepID=UPI0009BCC792|nr:phage tail protein [Sporosarcina sp. P33]ARD47578.1 hypothetical protein SporoP33_04545 [Sporosarcina sp. P33]
MSIVIKVDDATLRDIRVKLAEIPEKAPNAISASLNRTVTNISSNLSKEIRKTYTVKARDIKDTITRTRANPKKLSASVQSKGGTMGLDKFKTSALMVTKNKGGVKSVQLNCKPIKAAVKKGRLKTVVNAFAATANGAKIFKRKTKKRLPIERLHGPSVPQMAGNPQVVEVVEREGQAMFDRRIDHEINRILDKLGGSR